MSRLGRALGPGKLRLSERSRGHPQWVLDYTDGRGRRRREALGTDKRVAERRRAELIRQRDLELAGLGAVEGQSLPLRELMEVYIEHLRPHACVEHWKNVERRIGRALREMPCLRVRDLRPIDAMKHRNRLLAEGLGHRTANFHLDSLHAMLRWAVKAGLIAEDPLRTLARLPEDGKHVRCKRRAMSDEEIELFLQAARDDDRAKLRTNRRRVPQATLWRALLETGARYGELTSATWADMDFDRGRLRLRAETTKSAKERLVPITQTLLAELLGLRQVRERLLRRPLLPTERVFVTPMGLPWLKKSGGLVRTLNGLLQAAGIKRVDLLEGKLDVHALRHTSASRYARRGMTLVQVQRLLGHSSPVLTSRYYTHLDVEDLRGAVEHALAADRRPAAGRGWAG
jgi:integrase